MDPGISLETWAAFVAATVVVLATPGPTIMLVIGYALAEGRRAALGTVAGVALGDFTAMTLSFLGLGAVLSASAGLFTLVKVAGALFLIWLGIKAWRSRPAPPGAAPAPAKSRRAMLGHAWAVTALNPKGILFFVAFLPQFLSPAAPVVPQMLLLGGTFLALAVANAALYAMLAQGVRRAAGRPGILLWINRLGGSILIGAGLLTLTLRRPAAL